MYYCVKECAINIALKKYLFISYLYAYLLFFCACVSNIYINRQNLEKVQLEFNFALCI